MSSIKYFLLFMVAVAAAEKMPKFKEGESRHEVRVGQTVTLRCPIADLDIDLHSVMWQKQEAGGSRMLFADLESMSGDERVSIKHETPEDWHLVIKNVEPFDSGIYICQVTTEPMISLRQHLQVQVPPSISLQPDHNPYTVRPGENIQLRCSTQGNPEPKVTWKRLGSNLPDGKSEHEGQSLFYPKATVDHSGTYECTAANNVSPDARQTIMVSVQSENGKKGFKPIVSTAQSYVAAMPGDRLNISCKYDAQPIASADWLQGSFPVDFSDQRRQLYQSTTETIIEFVSIERKDYDTYTCRVQNSMGTEHKSIHVSGRPGPPAIEVEGDYGTYISLRWIVKSSGKPKKYEIRWQKFPGGDGWSSVKERLRTTKSGDDGLTWSASYVIEDVAPSSTYLIQVRAQNDIGWGSYPIQNVKHTTSVKKTQSTRSTQVSVGDQKPYSKSGSALYSSLITISATLLVLLVRI